MVAGIVGLALSGWLSWRQPVPGERSDVGFRENPVKWFFYPIEVHPWYRPPVYGFALNSVTVVPGTGGRSVFAVGRYGTILRTTDGGEHWEAQANLVPSDLNAVSFANPKIGWAVGFRYISDPSPPYAPVLGTKDGGETWVRLANEEESMSGNVSFVDAQNGWAPSDGSLLRTQDGGGHWRVFAPVNAPFGESSVFGVSFANFNVGCVVVWRRSMPQPQGGFEEASGCTRDAGTTWSYSPLGSEVQYRGIALADPLNGWVVGDYGRILRTSDGGANWIPQTSGTEDELRGVAFSDALNGWVVGEHGTILHTTDGGAHWKGQESAPYRRYPGPWFYAAILCLVGLILWAGIPDRVASSVIEDVMASDSPVESLEDDRLGQRALVERLTNFLSNPRTFPPLVISLQAKWGMGKSSVMKMLEANLKERRAAATVWFNAWHHQKEDQLLAYLLETIQKEALPQWFSAKGLPFRLNLLRVRLLNPNRLDRLALLALSLAFMALAIQRPEWFKGNAWGGWLLGAGYAVSAAVVLQLLTAFKSNPEKLTENAGGFVVDTFKELLRLPSLVGKSDVRQEFAENLRDVVAALKPHRLVIFLDDLDRCRPEQVVQILEAINFLSSAAPCFLIVGADYDKVETLVANQFQDLALREAENRTIRKSLQPGPSPGPVAHDPVKLRVDYAQNYLRKIVNLRINLHKPTWEQYPDFLTRDASVRRVRGRRLRMAGRLLCLVAPAVLVWVILNWQQLTAPPKPVAQAAVAGEVTKGTAPPKTDGAKGDGTKIDKPVDGGPTKPALNDKGGATPASVEDGKLVRNSLVVGLPALVAVLAGLYWISRPRKREEAADVGSFTAALMLHSESIFDKSGGSPREVRRFLNYLRLVTARSGKKETDEVGGLRGKFPGEFDDELVQLAVSGSASSPGPNGEIEMFYRKQCDLFGLDPSTFKPAENGDDSGAIRRGPPG